MMKPLTLAVDVDEVCAGLLGEWLRRYNFAYGDNKLPEDIRQWDMVKEVKPECGRKIYDILYEADLYDHVLPIHGARQRIYALAAAGHRIVFVTSCPTGTMDAKARWLVRWGFLPAQSTLTNFVATKRKELIRADILIDDGIHNVEAFPGPAILIAQPHNAAVGTLKRDGRWVRLSEIPSPDYIDYLRMGWNL